MSLLETTKLEGIGSVQELQQVVQYVKNLANMVVMLSDNLDHVVNGNLDVKNIRAKSITADRLDVDKLSAISADLGKVVAGILIGAYISTADGTYPRIDFTSSGNLLTAYTNANNILKIDPTLANPTLMATNGTVSGAISLFTFVGTVFGIIAQNCPLIIQADNDEIRLKAGTGKHVKIDDFDRLYSDGDGQTLQSALDNLQTQINGKTNTFSGFSGTFYVSSTLGGVIDQEVTVSNGIITSVL